MVSIRPDKAKLMARLHRIEGQVRGLERMVQEDKPCLDILTQLASVKSALKAIDLILIEHEFRYYLLQSASQAREEREVEANAVIEQIKMFRMPFRN